MVSGYSTLVKFQSETRNVVLYIIMYKIVRIHFVLLHNAHTHTHTHA